mgnify:FL=1
MPRYYHATPKENLTSIMKDGIQAQFGLVYCSTHEETSARWVCFSRMHSKEIVTLPFDRPNGDKRMSLGTDHSPILTKILGVEEEGASFVSSESIPTEDIDWDGIMVYQNPHYTKEAELQWLKMMKENKKILLEAGSNAMKRLVGEEE